MSRESDRWARLRGAGPVFESNPSLDAAVDQLLKGLENALSLECGGREEGVDGEAVLVLEHLLNSLELLRADEVCLVADEHDAAHAGRPRLSEEGHRRFLVPDESQPRPEVVERVLLREIENERNAFHPLQKGGRDGSEPLLPRSVVQANGVAVRTRVRELLVIQPDRRLLFGVEVVVREAKHQRRLPYRLVSQHCQRDQMLLQATLNVAA